MTAAHDRPNGRPIHPECPHILHPEALCECTARWMAWDGTEVGLRDKIGVAANREARRRYWDDHPPENEDLHGFWRESERMQSALVNLDKAG